LSNENDRFKENAGAAGSVFDIFNEVHFARMNIERNARRKFLQGDRLGRVNFFQIWSDFLYGGVGMSGFRQVKRLSLPFEFSHSFD
jgi:hypothetical protein